MQYLVQVTIGIIAIIIGVVLFNRFEWGILLVIIGVYIITISLKITTETNKVSQFRDDKCNNINDKQKIIGDVYNKMEEREINIDRFYQITLISMIHLTCANNNLKDIEILAIKTFMERSVDENEIKNIYKRICANECDFHNFLETEFSSFSKELSPITASFLIFFVAGLALCDGYFNETEKEFIDKMIIILSKNLDMEVDSLVFFVQKACKLFNVEEECSNYILENPYRE